MRLSASLRCWKCFDRLAQNVCEVLVEREGAHKEQISRLRADMKILAMPVLQKNSVSPSLMMFLYEAT